MASETEPFQLCLVQIDIYLPNLVTFSDFRLEEFLYIRCCLSDYILSCGVEKREMLCRNWPRWTAKTTIQK